MASLTGHLLIASPRLRDPNFLHTVLLVVQHDEEGAVALVLNRPSGSTIREAWEQLHEFACTGDQRLYQGGPCAGPLMALHDRPEEAQVQVLEGVSFTAEPEKLESLVASDPSPVKYFLGYAGWSPGQLEAELGEGSWLVAHASASLVFSEDPNQWAALMRAISRASIPPGLKPELMPDDPSVN